MNPAYVSVTHTADCIASYPPELVEKVKKFDRE